MAISSLADEKPLVLALVALVAGFALEHSILGLGSAAIWGAFLVLMLVIVGISFRVAHHAEVLAHRFGEPYGTLILTTAAVAVEVVMLVVIMSQTNSPTLARDTIFAAVMLDINGIIGFAAVVGGIKHGEQKYNCDSSGSYIGMLLVAIGITMFIPDFIVPEKMRMYSIFSIVASTALYVIFLRVQTVEHRSFFTYGTVKEVEKVDAPSRTPNWLHVGLLIGSIVVIGILAELLSVFMTEGLKGTSLPLAIPAVIVALISASPELLTAMRAALKDNMQGAMNVGLGASLATVLLTIPIVEGFAMYNDMVINMALTPVQAAMLLITLLVAMNNMHDGESNVLEGSSHVGLFIAFIAITFLG